MGEVISKQAARERIIEDVKTTVTRAAGRANGPDGWGAAATRLGPVLILWEATAPKAKAARAELAPLTVAIDVADDGSDRLLRATADALWNELGRPANDPLFELLFPAGAGFYADAPDAEQPDLMVLLAELLESNLHPKLAATATARAAEIRAAAASLEAALDAARKPRAKVRLLDRVLTSIARTAQIELAKLKRYWKSEGLSEADIHAVIPDRPRGYGVNEPASPPTDPTA